MVEKSFEVVGLGSPREIRMVLPARIVSVRK